MNTTYFAPALPVATRAIIMKLPGLQRQLRVAMLTQNISYSFFTLLVWDMLLTLKDEVHLIWPARWTVIKWVFLINRYGIPVLIALGFPSGAGYIQGLTDGFCRKWLLINLGTAQLSLLLVSFIMVFRLHAAWGTSRRLLLVLIALWLSGVTTTMFVWVHILYNQRAKIQVVEQLHVCFPAVVGLWGLFVPSVCLHFLLLIILIIKAIATPRSKDTAMLIVLLRDGIAFYSITFCALLTAVVVWAALGRFYNALPIYTTWCINTISTSHFLLSLKYSQAVQQSWVKQADNSTLRAPTRNLSHQSDSKAVEMDIRRDWKGVVLPGDSSASLRSDMQTLRTQYDLPKAQGTPSPQAPISSETILVRSPTTTSQDHGHYVAVAAVNQRRGFGGWWWWWPVGHSAVVEDCMVEVDARHAEWWDQWEDRGPGWQESQIGRYDGWL